MSDKKKVLFVSSDLFSEDDAGDLVNLAKSLAKSSGGSYDLRSVTPHYRQVDEDKLGGLSSLVDFQTEFSWRKEKVSVNKVEGDNITHYLVANNGYFHRETLHHEQDIHLQFSYFCRAVLDMLPKIDFKPDIIHCKGWHTAPLTILLKDSYGDMDFYKGIKSIFTIDDISSQGVFGRDIVGDVLDLDIKYFDEGFIEHDGLVNYLKMGVNFADVITTFCADYAQKILEPQLSAGLDYLIKMNKDKLYGINLDEGAKNYGDFYIDLFGEDSEESSIKEDEPKVVRLDLKVEKEEAVGDKININTANDKALKNLSGVGPALAARIVKYRDEAGAFNELVDVKKVSGIGKKLFEKIKNDIIT